LRSRARLDLPRCGPPTIPRPTPLKRLQGSHCRGGSKILAPVRSRLSGPSGRLWRVAGLTYLEGSAVRGP
jgi:hypothetical protein